MKQNTKQEPSYRKQIAHLLHTQYVDGIYRPKYYTVTLKSRVHHWIDQCSCWSNWSSLNLSCVC